MVRAGGDLRRRDYRAAAGGLRWRGIRLLYDRVDAIRCRDHLRLRLHQAALRPRRSDAPLMGRAAAVWDPAQYLRFSGERLRPALDLLAQVPLEAPASVVDLGCGAGNITAILRERFPDADVVGIDGSATMLEKARG